MRLVSIRSFDNVRMSNVIFIKGAFSIELAENIQILIEKIRVPFILVDSLLRNKYTYVKSFS